MKRMKPEYKILLDEHIKEYPNTTSRLIDALNTEVIYGDLKVIDAMVLNNYLLNNKGDLYTLNNVLFKPLKIK